jgi:hypothetical protein
MTLKYTIPLGSMIGKINSILSADELTLLVWQESTGVVYIYKNIGQVWTYLTYYSLTVLSSSMNSIALNSNGTIAIF